LRRAKNIFTHHHLLTKLHHIIATNICWESVLAVLKQISSFFPNLIVWPNAQ
jgi:hypothetical protein